MQTATMLGLAGATVCVGLFAWQRQWIMALAWVFSAAYTIFDKVVPGVLPAPVVTSFSYTFLALVLVFCIQRLFRKGPGDNKPSQ